MSNKKTKKTNIPEAPAEEAQVVNVPAQQTANVLDMTKFMENMTSATAEGLDPNRRVDLLRMMHETFRQDPNAAQRYNMPQDVVEKINGITAIGQIAALACEVTFAKNPFAVKMNIAQLAAISEVGEAVGVTIDMKALPAPGDDGTVTVESTAINVNEETKKKIKKEKEIEDSGSEPDPTKINNHEELRNALLWIMIHRVSGWEKIHDAINFYRSYASVVASKAENKDEELAKVKALTDLDILNLVKATVGKCPYVLNGMGRAMFTTTSIAKSPISAFCMFRNTTKNKKTGAYAIDDAAVANYVRSLITWCSEVNIANAKESIATYENDIKVLEEKDAKANEAGINDLKSKIEKANDSIKHYEEALSYVNEPSGEFVESFIDNYKAKDQTAMRTWKAISDSFYDDVKLSEMKPEGVYYNMKQRAGIITNLFRDPMAQLSEYAEGNITPLEPTDEAAAAAAETANSNEETGKK